MNVHNKKEKERNAVLCKCNKCELDMMIAQTEMMQARVSSKHPTMTEPR